MSATREDLLRDGLQLALTTIEGLVGRLAEAEKRIARLELADDARRSVMDREDRDRELFG